MPIVNTNFIAGRMNKSVDERLLPPGEYIDAMNVRLGSTETTEIGAVENSRGNEQLTTVQYLGVGLSSKDILKLYKKYENFRAIKGESSAALIQSEISKYPKDLRVFNGRGGQEIVDNFIVGCRGIVPALENADNFIKIYKYIQNKKFDNAHKEYMKILPSIVFIMQSINSLVCYGKRICAYRMGVKTIYDRSPGMIPTSFGLRKSKEIAKNLGLF